jgi:tRNA threonylcarbamoyladenosine biosynthesis protein TsaB
MTGAEPEIIEETELAGRSYSATLVSAIGRLLDRAGVDLHRLGAIVAVNGPGSFTGVRVGLSAVKGLVEAVPLPLVAVSRLEVLAAKAHAPSAALDAHRCEVFLRLAASGKEPAELLAGAAELDAISPPPGAVAVCDDAAARLILTTWPAAQLARVPAPTAADALRLAASRVAARSFIDPLALDGHYLRRSDAEIFSRPAAETPVRR